VKKLLVTLLVLVALLVGADRIAAYVAAQQVAGKIRTSAMLAADPKVKIAGFPFLTQAFAGRYDRIDVTADDVDRGGVRLTHFTTSLYGVQLPLSDALGGRVQSIPVDRLTGQAVVGYVDLKSSGRMLVFTPDGDRVKVTGSISVLGQDISASASSTVSLDGNDLVLTPQSVSAAGQSSNLIGDAIKGAFRVRVPLGRLPYGLKLTGVKATAAGVVVSAESGPTVLTTR
jgi:hypothetical protein